jgi:hypothetical protein
MLKGAETTVMTPQDIDTLPTPMHDKQLQGIAFEAVMAKRRLDQALNAKEFAVCAGVSYSTARSWFHLPGFPVIHGVIFWQDFVQWRAGQYGLMKSAPPQGSGGTATETPPLPPRAAQILLDASTS